MRKTSKMSLDDRNFCFRRSEIRMLVTIKEKTNSNHFEITVAYTKCSFIEVKLIFQIFSVSVNEIIMFNRN